MGGVEAAKRGEDIGEGKGLRWIFSIIKKVAGIYLGFLVLAILCNALWQQECGLGSGDVVHGRL